MSLGSDAPARLALARSESRRRRLARAELVRHTSLIVLAILTLYPLAFMVMSSTKDETQFNLNFFWPAWPIHLVNYQDAWSGIVHFILNTLFVACTSVLGIMVLSSLAAYAFARLWFPLKGVLFTAVIALLMVPSLFTLIPLFLEVKSFGLLNTYAGLILPYIAAGQAFTVFVLRSFFAGLPEELFEAARIDGCGELRVFWQVALPLSKPIVSTMVIINLLSVWNDYIWPLVVLSDQRFWTITLGILSFADEYVGQVAYGPMFAGFVLATLPLLILFAFSMNYFIEGITSGALKV